MSGRPAVALFARDPRLEAANKPLVAGRSVPVHAALLADAAERMRRVHGDLVLVWQGEPEKAWALRPRAVVPQRGRTFGDRVAAAARDVGSLGYERMALAAADCPGLSAADAEGALADLARVQAAWVGCTDGGVNLLALRPAAAALLDLKTLPWETSSLATALAERAAAVSLPARALPGGPDVDGPEDLARFLRAHPETRLARLVLRAMGPAGVPGAAARPGRAPLTLFSTPERDPIA